LSNVDHHTGEGERPVLGEAHHRDNVELPFTGKIDDSQGPPQNPDPIPAKGFAFSAQERNESFGRKSKVGVLLLGLVGLIFIIYLVIQQQRNILKSRTPEEISTILLAPQGKKQDSVKLREIETPSPLSPRIATVIVNSNYALYTLKKACGSRGVRCVSMESQSDVGSLPLSVRKAMREDMASDSCGAVLDRYESMVFEFKCGSSPSVTEAVVSTLLRQFQESQRSTPAKNIDLINSSISVLSRHKGQSTLSRELKSAKSGNKLIVAYVWAAWCGPCIEELPILEGLASTHSATTKFIGLFDKSGMGTEETKRVIANLSGSYKNLESQVILIDQSLQYSTFGGKDNPLPIFLLIDENLMVREALIGSLLHKPSNFSKISKFAEGRIGHFGE
jgi:thiol-disulfide isomerase/thioredoxin